MCFYLWNTQNARVARVETDTRTYPVIIHVAILFLFGLDGDGFAQVPALKYESKKLLSDDIISDRRVDFKETPVPFHFFSKNITTVQCLPGFIIL